ncbi:unnamed protein product [Clonostachys rosea f. rosea IK726]|uniref:N-acetyltransferase domain-containing protein n=2 Tax=Bionectria ochroleuca TaxID=29856 RepID=A0A8H7NHD7_BIOOC|nr:unnamed protein product [Clonostachys rosea f. rosea IK726]
MAVSAAVPTTLRPATTQDASQVSKLGALVFSTTFGHSVTHTQLQSYLEESYSIEATIKDITDPNKDMLVAETDEGVVVGFALLTRGSSEPCVENISDTVELQRIYVDTSCHGTGLGKRLALELERMAREQGFKHIWLGVWEDNQIAQKFYERLGYKVIGDHDFDIGGDIQTDHIMIKDL